MISSKSEGLWELLLDSRSRDCYSDSWGLAGCLYTYPFGVEGRGLPSQGTLSCVLILLFSLRACLVLSVKVMRCQV